MIRNIPQITISKTMTFNPAGMPDCELYEIAAIIDTPDEISPLGRIRFESPEDLIHLYNTLGNYIRINDIDLPDDEPGFDDPDDDDEIDHTDEDPCRDEKGGDE